VPGCFELKPKPENMKLSKGYLALIVSFALIGSLLYFFTDIVTYVIIAWVLSTIGQPLVDFFNGIKIWKFRIGLNISAVLTILIFFLVVGLFFWLFAPKIIEQVNNLAHVDYNAIGTALREPLQNLENRLSQYGIIDAEVSLEQQLQQTLSKWFEPAFLGKSLGTVISAAGNIMVGIASVVFILFFLLKEQRLFVNFLAALMPKQYEQQVYKAVSDISVMLSRYFRGILIQMTAITIIVTLGLKIFGIKNAFLIGVFAAILNVIPYIGPIIGAVFGVILTISANLDLEFYNHMLPLIIKVIGVFVVMQMVDNYFLTPYIFSSSILAHPLEIFIIVLMGAKVNGVVGMILAIPVYTVLRAVAKAFLSEFNIVQHLTERIKDVGNHDT
jgi:predicted PurR-regulated permease PerM